MNPRPLPSRDLGGPLYLSGVIRPELAGLSPRLGFLHTLGSGSNKLPPGVPWALDNGAATSRGIPWGAIDRHTVEQGYGTPEDAVVEMCWYIEDRYTPDELARCLWFVIPDAPLVAQTPTGAQVIGTDWETTDLMACHSLRTFAECGLPLAQALNPGAEDDLDGIVWGALRAVFLAGPDEWQFGPAGRAIVERAHAEGVWVHVARVNSGRRYRLATELGADTVDGTFLRFGRADVDGWPENLGRLLSWLDEPTPPPRPSRPRLVRQAPLPTPAAQLTLALEVA